MTHITHHHHFFNKRLLFGNNRTLRGESQGPWAVALGAAFVILGTVGLAMVVLMTLASIVLFGILVLIGGTAQVMHAFSDPGWKDRISHLLIGLLYMSAGVIIILDPVVASAILTALLACALILIGIFRVGAVRAGAGRWQAG